MKLLWMGEWLDAPCYSRPERSRLVRVLATHPVASLAAMGRVYEDRYRKVLRFLVLEGPFSTYRKARSKVDEHRFSGDYHVNAVLGEDIDSGATLVGLACHAPPCAQHLVLHEDLVHEVDPPFSMARFAFLGQVLEMHEERLAELGNQSYLYSGEAPPPGLREALVEALGRSQADAPSRAAGLLSPPRANEEASTATSLRLSEPKQGRISVALLGAGDYARIEVVPALRRRNASFVAVADREPQIAAQTAVEHGFAVATTDPEVAIGELPASGLVVVATAHDSHAQLAAVALDAGHRVFLEKPPVVTHADLRLLLDAWQRAPGRLEIGFNRRYARLVGTARRALAREQGPLTISCVIREVPLNADHWYLWPNQGTRVTGNLCHWLDLAIDLMERRSPPVEVMVSPAAPGNRIDEERTIVVTFEDGSVLTVVATGRGDDMRGVQEVIEARRGATTVMIDDLRKITILRRGATSTHRTLWRKKGHAAMYAASVDRLIRGEPAPYSVQDLVHVSVTQIVASDLTRGTEGGVAPVGSEVNALLHPAAQVSTSRS